MGPSDATLLAPTVRERARILAPSLFVAMVFFVVTAGPLGIQPGWPWRLVPWTVTGVLAVLSVTLVARWVPDRWIHLASAATLWCLFATTLVGLGATRDVNYCLLLTSLIVSTGVLLHRGFAIGTLVAAVGASIPLVARVDAGHLATRITVVVVAAGFALVIHVLMRRAMVRSELLRVTEAEQRERLARQLAQLERAQAERASLEEQLLHAQRLEAIGTLAAGVAHDMNNVLASITSFASLAVEQSRDPAMRADLAQIVAQADRGAALTRGLLAFSRRGQYRKQPLCVADAITEVVPLLQQTLATKTLTIRTDLALDGACIEADPVQLHQVLINLGLNAADATDSAGALTLRGSIVTLAAGDIARLPGGRYVRLAVADTGKGMDAATRSRVFEPFFTTKPQGQGTGLGLAIVWGIVQGHQGAIDVESQPGRGTTFVIHLPLSDRAPAPRAAAAPAAPPAIEPTTRTPTVLVVDDEPVVRTGTKRLLERLGLTVLVAGNGEEALRVFASARDRIDLVMLDMGMPVMGGAECFKLLREQSQVPVLITTGYASDAEAQALIAAGGLLMEKPYTPAALRAEVTRILVERARASGLRLQASGP